MHDHSAFLDYRVWRDEGEGCGLDRTAYGVGVLGCEWRCLVGDPVADSWHVGAQRQHPSLQPSQSHHADSDDLRHHSSHRWQGHSLEGTETRPSSTRAFTVLLFVQRVAQILSRLNRELDHPPLIAPEIESCVIIDRDVSRLVAVFEAESAYGGGCLNWLRLLGRRAIHLACLHIG